MITWNQMQFMYNGIESNYDLGITRPKLIGSENASLVADEKRSLAISNLIREISNYKLNEVLMLSGNEYGNLEYDRLNKIYYGVKPDALLKEVRKIIFDNTDSTFWINQESYRINAFLGREEISEEALSLEEADRILRKTISDFTEHITEFGKPKFIDGSNAVAEIARDNAVTNLIGEISAYKAKQVLMLKGNVLGGKQYEKLRDKYYGDTAEQLIGSLENLLDYITEASVWIERENYTINEWLERRDNNEARTKR